MISSMMLYVTVKIKAAKKGNIFSHKGIIVLILWLKNSI